MTFGAKLYEAFALERQSGPIDKARWIELADREHGLAIATATASGKVAKVSKAYLDTLFDALAELHGGTTNLTRSMKGVVVDARKQIMEATPGVTADEIVRRTQAYKRRHPTWPLTASALCKHWGELGATVGSTRAALDDPYQEPAGDWRAAARAVTGVETLPEDWAIWANVPHNWKEQIKKATK